jgi:hypothetical protein
MGATDHYAILAFSTITSSGLTVVGGNLGVSSGTSVTGFGIGSGTYSGVTDINNAATEQAQTDLLSTINDANSRSFNQQLPAVIINLTLGPGVYKAVGSVSISGILMLDCQMRTCNFIFQIPTSLNLTPNAVVMFKNIQSGSVAPKVV